MCVFAGYVCCCVCVCVCDKTIDESNVSSVISKPSQSSSRCVSSFQDSSKLLNIQKLKFTKVRSF